MRSQFLPKINDAGRNRNTDRSPARRNSGEGSGTEGEVDVVCGAVNGADGGHGCSRGHHANEALIERVKASDQWNFYQAKNLKQEIAINTDQVLMAVTGKKDSAAHAAEIARYDKEKAAIRSEAEADEQRSESHLARHVPLASAVTAFQIAIAVSAISILTRRKKLWFGSLVLTAVGIVFLVFGLLR